MSQWGYFAIITVAVTIAIATWAIRDRRRAAVARHRNSLSKAFGEAACGRRGADYLDEDAVSAMVRHGWTVGDARDLGLALRSGTEGCGLDPREQVRARVASQASRFLGALAGRGLLGGSSVRTQMTWITLLAVEEVRAVEERRPLPPQPGMFWGSDGKPAAAQQWHRAVGSLAPYAIAAGFTIDEAVAGLGGGDLDADVMMTLAALRGVYLPAPSPDRPADHPAHHPADNRVVQ